MFLKKQGKMIFTTRMEVLAFNLSVESLCNITEEMAQYVGKYTRGLVFIIVGACGGSPLRAPILFFNGI